MSEIKILRLVNGDDIIAEVEAKDVLYKISKPARLMMFLSDNGEMGMDLVPWVPYSDQQNFSINDCHVMISIEPSTELRNEYNKEYGSGIEIVEDNPGGIII